MMETKDLLALEVNASSSHLFSKKRKSLFPKIIWTLKMAQIIQKCMFWALKPKQKWDFFIKKAFFYLFLKQVGQATINFKCQ